VEIEEHSIGLLQAVAGIGTSVGTEGFPRHHHRITLCPYEKGHAMNRRVLLFLLKLLFSYKRNKAKIIDAIGKIRVSLFPMWVLYQPLPYKVTG
jgi:hypothetical protein